MIIIILLEPNLCCVRAKSRAFWWIRNTYIAIEARYTRCLYSSACEQCVESHSSRILYAIRKLRTDKEWKRSNGIAKKKPITRYFLFALMAQFAIWILIFFSAASFRWTVCVARAHTHFEHSLKLMCLAEEECLPHLFDVCVVLRLLWFVPIEYLTSYSLNPHVEFKV